MFIEFFGFPGTGKSTAARALNNSLLNLDYDTRLYLHGNVVCKDLSLNNNSQTSELRRPKPKIIDQAKLFFILFFQILTGPADVLTKLRFFKRLFVLFKILQQSWDKVIICDEGFLQLYTAAKMPTKQPLDLHSMEPDIVKFFTIVSNVIIVSCNKDLIYKRLASRVTDHSRVGNWGIELRETCFGEHERISDLIEKTGSVKVFRVSQTRARSKHKLEKTINDLAGKIMV